MYLCVLRITEHFNRGVTNAYRNMQYLNPDTPLPRPTLSHRPIRNAYRNMQYLNPDTPLPRPTLSSRLATPTKVESSFARLAGPILYDFKRKPYATKTRTQDHARQSSLISQFNLQRNYGCALRLTRRLAGFSRSRIRATLARVVASGASRSRCACSGQLACSPQSLGGLAVTLGGASCWHSREPLGTTACASPGGASTS